jgi:hypothetical protein
MPPMMLSPSSSRSSKTSLIVFDRNALAEVQLLQRDWSFIWAVRMVGMTGYAGCANLKEAAGLGSTPHIGLSLCEVAMLEGVGEGTGAKTRDFPDCNKRTGHGRLSLRAVHNEQVRNEASRVSRHSIDEPS